MIRYIKLREYKGLKNVEYNFGSDVRTNSKIEKLDFQINENFNLIYGKNAIGKTRLLSVIEHLKSILFSNCENIDDANYFISLDTKNYIYNIDVETSGKRLSNLIITFSKINSRKIEELLLYKTDNKLPTVKIFGEKISTGDIFELISNKENSFLTNILNLAQNNSEIDALIEVGDFLFSNVMVRFEKDIKEKYSSWNELIPFKNLQFSQLIEEKEVKRRKQYSAKLSLFFNEIDPHIVNIDFGEYPFDKEINGVKWYKQETIQVELDNGNKYSIHSNDISQGVSRLVLLLNNLIWVTEKEGRVLVIDEFDPFVHDFLYISIIRVLSSIIYDKSQIIASSHNSVVLNELKRKQIVFMDEDEDGKIQLFNPNAKDINYERSNIYKRYLNQDYIKNTIFDSDIEDLFSEK